jgi:hypothetical protein
MEEFMILKIVLALLLAFVNLPGYLVFAAEETSLEALEKMIKDLEERKSLLETKAAIHRDQAQRWQFQTNGDWADAKKAWEMADREQAAADALGKKIEELKAQYRLQKEEG